MKIERNYFISVIVFSLLFIAGCASTNKSHVFSKMSVNTSSELDAKIEVDLSNKLTGTSTTKYLFKIIQLEGDNNFADGYGGFGSVGKTKSAAAYNAISSSDADVLVSPQYVITMKDNFFIQEITVTVTGFGGKIKSIKNKE